MECNRSFGTAVIFPNFQYKRRQEKQTSSKVFEKDKTTRKAQQICNKYMYLYNYDNVKEFFHLLSLTRPLSNKTSKIGTVRVFLIFISNIGNRGNKKKQIGKNLSISVVVSGICWKKKKHSVKITSFLCLGEKTLNKNVKQWKNKKFNICKIEFYSCRTIF